MSDLRIAAVFDANLPNLSRPVRINSFYDAQVFVRRWAIRDKDRVIRVLLRRMERANSSEVPSILQGQRPFDLIKGGIAGAILITAVGFNWAGYGFGWTLRSTAEQKAKDAEEAAIVRVLAPICADKFRQASDSVAKLAALKGTDSWKRDDFIKDTGYATFPGSEYDRKVAETCVELLTQVK